MFFKGLGNGIVARQATAADQAAIVALNRSIHDDGNWTQVLSEGSHPTTSIADFFVAEDTGNHRIVSTMCLIPQVWTYAGVGIPVVRPDLVSTDPEYRGSGLMKALFDMAHACSDQRGYLMQTLVGRPWFYRQFGYTLALPYGGNVTAAAHGIPELQAGETEPYVVREAKAEDVKTIKQIYDLNRKRYLVSCVREEKLWHYEMFERDSPEERVKHCIIEDYSGNAVGYVIHAPEVYEGEFVTFMAEVQPSVAWLGVAPSLLRYLRATGQALAKAKGAELKTLGLMQSEHPLHQACPDLFKLQEPTYAWYLRVPDLTRLLWKLAPVLERRLADSICCGYTGELEISFYKSGLVLCFQSGKLTEIKPLPFDKRTNARFPVEDFIKLVFGYRSLSELYVNYPEVSAAKEARPLLEALFPKAPSRIFSVC